MKVDGLPDEGAQDPSRFRRCRRALDVPVGRAPGATEASPYRRCPVGVISTLDCPEYVGLRCGYQEDRGDDPATVVRPEEVDVLRLELARDFLTPSYARRIAALRAGPPAPRRGEEILAAHPVEAPPAGDAPPARRTHLVSPGPVNVGPDRDGLPRARSAP